MNLIWYNRTTLSNGKKTIMLKLSDFIQSGKLPKCPRCDNCFKLRLDKILKSFGRFPVAFKLDCSSAMLFSLILELLLYAQKYKKSKDLKVCTIGSESAEILYGKRCNYLK